MNTRRVGTMVEVWLTRRLQRLGLCFWKAGKSDYLGQCSGAGGGARLNRQVFYYLKTDIS